MCHTRVVETENRYLEEGMEFVHFSCSWPGLHCWLTSLLEKVSRRRRIIFYPSIHLWVQPYLYILPLDLKLQQLAKTKSKTDIEHPPKIGTRFWKIKRYLTKMFYRFFIQKIGYEMQNDKKLWQIQITSFTREQSWHMLKNAYNVLLYIRPWT